MPLLTGKGRFTNQPIIHHGISGKGKGTRRGISHAIRDGKWKLIDGSIPELYNMENDIEEAENLYLKHPKGIDEYLVK